VIGRRVEHGHQQSVLGEAVARADEKVAAEPGAARSQAQRPVAPGEEDHAGDRGGGRAHEQERLGDAGPGGNRLQLVGGAGGDGAREEERQRREARAGSHARKRCERATWAW